MTATERQQRWRKKVRQRLKSEPKRLRRGDRERALAERTIAATKALGGDGERYGVLYADPPWRFEPRSRETGMDRAADNHYPTMTLEEIKGLPVPAAEDCVLFLCATAPMLPQALEVMAAWGFTYKSHMVWVKDKIGTGYWFRSQHELLLVGTRGDVPAPAPGEQPRSVIEAERGLHSEKPQTFRAMIEALYPTTPKFEMFARGGPVPGWERWGNETAPARPQQNGRVVGRQHGQVWSARDASSGTDAFC